LMLAPVRVIPLPPIFVFYPSGLLSFALLSIMEPWYFPSECYSGTLPHFTISAHTAWPRSAFFLSFFFFSSIYLPSLFCLYSAFPLGQFPGVLPPGPRRNSKILSCCSPEYHICPLGGLFSSPFSRIPSPPLLSKTIFLFILEFFSRFNTLSTGFSQFFGVPSLTFLFFLSCYPFLEARLFLVPLLPLRNRCFRHPCSFFPC